jgi:hypothetical protein
MSGGPDRTQRIVGAILDAEPDNAFTTEELCERVYPGVSVEKKHRLSVIRAGRALAGRRAEIGLMTGEGLGREFVFYRRDRFGSYVMARLKASHWRRYRSKYPRVASRNATGQADPRKRFEDDLHRELMAPGGPWWQEVQIFLAERDGDVERADELKAQVAREFARRMGRPYP